MAYFLALLLVRRRALSEERRVETHGASSPEDTLAESDLWTLTSAADGRVWNVPVREPTAEQLPELEAELSTLLFTEE